MPAEVCVAGDEAVPGEGALPAGARGEEVVEDVVRVGEEAEGGVEVEESEGQVRVSPDEGSREEAPEGREAAARGRVERERGEERGQEGRGEEVRVGLEVGEHAVEGGWRSWRRWKR